MARADSLWLLMNQLHAPKRFTPPTHSQSRGVLSKPRPSCNFHADPDNLSTTEFTILHGRQQMKSATPDAPDRGSFIGVSLAHFSCNYPYSYTGTYRNFQPNNTGTYRNFFQPDSTQLGYTKLFTAYSATALKLLLLNQYTQTRRHDPPVVCCIFSIP